MAGLLGPGFEPEPLVHGIDGWGGTIACEEAPWDKPVLVVQDATKATCPACRKRLLRSEPQP